MEITVQVSFQQILTLVRTLTPTQKARLRKELTEATEPVQDKSHLIESLLNGPVITEEEISVMEGTHKSINEWRIKS